MINFQWALFEANLDPVIGTEQKGSRPVLVVSNEEYNQSMLNVTVIPLSSTQRRMYPAEVFLAKGMAGQNLDSIIMAHQIRTISKKRLGKVIGSLDDQELRSQICQALKEHLDLG